MPERQKRDGSDELNHLTFVNPASLLSKEDEQIVSTDPVCIDAD